MQHPPTAFPFDLGIDFVLPHPLICAGSVSDLPLGFMLASASQALCPRYMYLSCVVPSYFFVLLAHESMPLSKENHFAIGCGWVGSRFGLKCISFLDGLKVFLVCEFVCSLSRVSFFWVACMWRLLVRSIQAGSFSVVSTHSTEGCFPLYSNWFTGSAGSDGCSERDGGWTVVRGFCLPSVVTGLFLSNENTIGPAIDLLALVLREASRDRR